MSENVLSLKVSVKGLENQLVREFEILDSSTLGELAALILVTFHAQELHDYEFIVKDTSCFSYKPEKIGFIDEEQLDGRSIPLDRIDWKVSKTIRFNYFGNSMTQFFVQCVGIKEHTNIPSECYPILHSGKGMGLYELNDNPERDLLLNRLERHSLPFEGSDESLQEALDWSGSEFDMNLENKDLLERVSKVENIYLNR